MVLATSPYSLAGSSSDEADNVSKIRLIPSAGTPLMTNGFKVSKVPIAEYRITPPFGACGLA